MLCKGLITRGVCKGYSYALSRLMQRVITGGSTYLVSNSPAGILGIDVRLLDLCVELGRSEPPDLQQAVLTTQWPHRTLT